MCQSDKTKRFRLLEVETKANQTEYTLQDNDNLNTVKRISAIEAYRVSKVAISPKGRAVISDAVFNKTFLTLATSDTDQQQHQIPLTDLCRADNNGQLFYVDIKPIAASKCVLKIASVAGILDTESILIGVHYE